jgi:hypothetical protein
MAGLRRNDPEVHALLDRAEQPRIKAESGKVHLSSNKRRERHRQVEVCKGSPTATPLAGPLGE